MDKKNMLILLIAFTLVCDTMANDNIFPNKVHFLSRVYSKEKLDKILKRGMSQEEVIKNFGEPFIKSDNTFTYSINPQKNPAKDKTKFFISGFQVFLFDGKVKSWELIWGIESKCKTIPPKSGWKEPNILNKNYTKEDIDKLLSIGMTESEVIKKLGEPLLKTPIEGISKFYYQVNPMLIPDDKINVFIGGMNIFFKKEKIVAWEVYFWKTVEDKLREDKLINKQ